MNKAILAALVAVPCMFSGSIVKAQEISYTPIPAGFDFPADERVLLDALKNGDEAALRAHAWMVFGGLTQKVRPSESDSEAIWETWYSGNEVFGADAQPQAIRTIQRNLITPRQFLQDGAMVPQAVGLSQLSFTLFNQELKDHTRAEKLNLFDTMKAINDGWTPTTPVEERKIKDYPREAMSLKLAWMPVAKNGLTALPVWDELPIEEVAGSHPVETWKRRVAVDPSRTSIPQDETADLPGFPDSKVVPLADFYHFEMTADQAATFGAQEGDYAVLVAMHYTTKEIPNWVWATFWWHDKPNSGAYAAGRPDEKVISGPWQNFLMDVAYDMDVPKEANGTTNVVFNPWLEAGFANGVNSNCMTCHQRAVWADPPRHFLPVTRGHAAANDPIFLNSTKADFLWSLLLEGNR